MKRYTFFTDDYPVVTCDHCYEDQNENYCGPAIERLEEYEATGLMPAEVAALQYQLRHARGGQRWIPVSERLPKKEGWYQVYTSPDKGHKSINKARYSLEPEWSVNAGKGRWNGSGGTWTNVTHWMPLPEPPKEV